MLLDDALRLTEIILAFAFILQSLEHLRAPKDDHRLFAPRLALSLALLIGIQTPWVCLALLLLSLPILKRFNGPYNGGSDRMGLLILAALTAAHFAPAPHWQEYIFAYLALQCLLSYVIAGWVKLTNPDWRNGQALIDVFRFSAYPVTENTRLWANKPKTLRAASWAVITLELAFPLALLTPITLFIGLTLAAAFHLANALLLGLNRFFWIWLAAYPSLIWLQSRLDILSLMP